MRHYMLSSLSLATILLLSPLSASAAFTGPGSTPEVNSAAQVAQAPDDAFCRLEGNLTEMLRGDDDKYIFQDSSGTVVVEIDEDVFFGRTVTPATRVRLAGEVDAKLFRANQVDVEWMEIL